MQSPDARAALSLSSAAEELERPPGEKKTSLLLASGWWGVARHFHYLPEISASFFWTAPALFGGDAFVRLWRPPAAVRAAPAAEPAAVDRLVTASAQSQQQWKL